MLTDGDLREILSYQPDAPVLSIYLSTDPLEGNADTHKLRLRSLLKEVELPDDVNAVIRHFDHEHDWSGRSVAIFSCAPENYLKVFSLGVPVRSRVRVHDRPYVKPLADLLESYGGYGVVLIDKQGARLFHFHLGELLEQEGVVGEAIRHTKRGGGSQSPGRRGGMAGQTDHVDEVTDRNIKDAIEFATKFFAEKNVRRVVVGGTDDNVALFRSHLPKAWQSLVVGTFPMSMVATHPDVLERAMAIGEAAEHRRESNLINAVVTNAAKGKGGANNLAATLEALREGRVQTLVVQEGFRAPGSRCTGCGHLAGHFMETCPYCGAKCEEVPDAVELAVRQVMQTGGDVEFYHGEPVNGFEKIGALLRY